MAKQYTAEEREARILEHMEVANKSRQEAEFMVAIETGEIDGDEEVIEEADA